MKYINLKTKIPHPKDLDAIKELKKYEARSMHGQLPIVWDIASDFLVYDSYGNRFLDFTSGICVANSGHSNDNICKTLHEMITQGLLHTYTFPTEVRYKFIKKLIETCYPKGKAFLASAGTEVTEVACKLMRMWGIKHNIKKRRLISFVHAMHGRTMLPEKLKGETSDNDWAEPYDSNIIQIPFPKREDSFAYDLNQYYPYNLEEICGVIIESYQGWSASFYPKDYIKEIMILAKKHKWLICFDEIQSGFGRTGKMFAFEHYDLQRKPDLICCGKGISSSLPLSAVIGRSDILDIPQVGSMSSTHSANPLSCASGYANLLEIKRLNLVEEAERKGRIILRELLEFDDGINYEINGKGMVWAIVTKKENEATHIVWECFKRGLLLIWTHKNSVKIAPPLTITDDALLEGLSVIKSIL